MGGAVKAGKEVLNTVTDTTVGMISERVSR